MVFTSNIVIKCKGRRLRRQDRRTILAELESTGMTSTITAKKVIHTSTPATSMLLRGVPLSLRREESNYIVCATTPKACRLE